MVYFVFYRYATLPAELEDFLVGKYGLVLFVVLWAHFESMIESSLTNSISTLEMLSLIWLIISKRRCLLSAFYLRWVVLAKCSIFFAEYLKFRKRLAKQSIINWSRRSELQQNVQMFLEFLLSLLNVLDHAKRYPGVVDLLQADYHPEEVGKDSSQLRVPNPILLTGAHLVFLTQSTIVHLHHSPLQRLTDFPLFLDIESFVLSGPFIEEVAQIESDIIKLAKLKI